MHPLTRLARGRQAHAHVSIGADSIGAITRAVHRGLAIGPGDIVIDDTEETLGAGAAIAASLAHSGLRLRLIVAPSARAGQRGIVSARLAAPAGLAAPTGLVAAGLVAAGLAAST